MKRFLLLLLFSGIGVTHAQTLISSVRTELRKPVDKRQLFSSARKDGAFFAFASDKKSVHCLKYNQALFFRDSLSTDVSTEFGNMVGSSFDNSETAYLYWASEDFSKIRVTSFDFTNRKCAKNVLSFSFQKETFVTSFNNEDVFYFLTVSDEKPELKIRAFQNGYPEEHAVDFSSFDLVDGKDKKQKLSDLLVGQGLQIIDHGSFPSLLQSSAPIKLYPSNGFLTMTFNLKNESTQIFRISTKDYSVSESKIPQPEMSSPDVSQSNSFLLDSLLFQIRFSEKELVLEAKRLPDGKVSDQNAKVSDHNKDASGQTGKTPDQNKNVSDQSIQMPDQSVKMPDQRVKTPDQTVKTLNQYRTKLDESLDFRNSPMLIQNGNKRPSEISTTKKFLPRLARTQPAISAYASPQGILVTCGGAREIADTGSVIVGATLGIGVIAAGGGGYDPNGFTSSRIPQTVYFESLFDRDFIHVTDSQKSIAFDFLSDFFAQNEYVVNYCVTPFNQAQILTYYDSRQKAIILRKFQETDSGFEAIRK